MATSAPITIRREEEDIVRVLEEIMDSGRAALVGPTGERQELPQEVCSLFLQVLTALRQGKAVSIMPCTQSLTTQQAAKILGTSRQFLVGLLESGEIPFYKVGTHRRIYLRDLLAYEEVRDQRRRAALRELSRASLDAGIYDKVFVPEE